MQESLHSKTYLTEPRKRRDVASALVSILGLFAVGWVIIQASSVEQLLDLRSLLIVGLGTIATILLQYDFHAFFSTIGAVIRSFFGTPQGKVERMLREVDDAIVQNEHLATLREGERITGELLNDVVYMYNRGLLFDEIDKFIAARLEDELTTRRVSADLLRRAALTAPALGLFGTVIGLTGVLRSMDDPTQIGPQMSLALMTTAYGAGLGSLFFTPLAGRLEHHNLMFLESHKQLLSRIGILLSREEREFSVTHNPKTEEDDDVTTTGP